MAITRVDTKRISEHAHLDLTSDEITKFTPQLSEVVELMDELHKVDTDDTEPLEITDQTNVLRADEIDVTKCLSQDGATSGSENIKNGYFEVTAILKNKE